jgi:hypothetical protein
MSRPDAKGVYHIDDAYLWLEQDSSIMLKCVTKHGDPAELTPQEALELAEALTTLAHRLRDEGNADADPTA